MDSKYINKLEEAYLLQNHEASVGRLFRGLTHNMNGFIHAVSMNSELVSLMFGKAEQLIETVKAELPEGPGREALDQLSELLGKRALMIGEVARNIEALSTIMRSTSALPMKIGLHDADNYTINDIVKDELVFLNADGFCKHKIKKELLLAENMPKIKDFLVEIHAAVFEVFSNACDALKQDIDGPQLVIETYIDNGFMVIAVQDNGLGIAPTLLEQIFEPFFSTKDNSNGMGLYLAKKGIASCGGDILVESSAGRTRFAIKIPYKAV